MRFKAGFTAIRRCSQWRPVKLGDINAKLPQAKDTSNVPVKYLSESNEHPGTWGLLRWMLQKDSLGQDIFLLGPPGSYKRSLLFKYLEFANREAEYVALSADTTDSDLKQYRELSKGEANWKDQAAVRAATSGRILILDGVERAERNLLPLINNLLENREMQLDDGGFLLKAEKYDELKEEVGEEKLRQWGMRRVHPGFRVVALGLPVPPFKGNSLDPPFRSRFQCKSIQYPSYEDAKTDLTQRAPGCAKHMKPMLDIVYTINSKQMEALGLPYFPYDSMVKMAKLLEQGISFRDCLESVYPSFHLSTEVRKTLEDLISKQKIKPRRGSSSSSHVAFEDGLVISDTLRKSIDSIKTSLAIGDVCIVGHKGSGKTSIARYVAKKLGQADNTVQISLYKDMSGREVIQSRHMNEGTTVWKDSPIVQAALNGSCLILDGIDTLDQTVLSSLQSLVFDRELWLSDGSKIIRQDRWEALGKPNNIRPVHPDFKIIALAEPPKKDAQEKTWLSPEVCAMFTTHRLPPLPLNEEIELLTQVLGFPPPDLLVKVTHALRSSSDASMRALANCLSTRQLLRISRKLHEYPNLKLYNLIADATLIEFAPQLTQVTFREIVSSAGVSLKHEIPEDISLTIDDKTVTIGDVVLDKNFDHDTPAKIPSTLYFQNARQLQQLYRIGQDLKLGDHLLLVGNQGVGKNKMVDHLLNALNEPREYMQLHRDTTVSSLCIQAHLIDGSIIYEDSALIKAVREGRILVLDEADKAPVQVTRVIYSLLARGEMLLPDGRRVVPKEKNLCSSDEIPIHPKFQAIVLANRPGFPFMGHDFFPLVCDAFSVHTIDAPDSKSEMSLLENYAPNIPRETLQQLVQLFADLRELYNSGQISYPFSTRELVSVTKHLSAFPEDGLLQSLSNVLDFDSYEPNARKLIGNVVRSYGIPFDTEVSDIFLGITKDLPSFSEIASFAIKNDSKVPVERKPLKFIDQQYLSEKDFVSVGSSFPRIEKFTELSQQWMAPFTRVNDLIISGGKPFVFSYEGTPVIGGLDLTTRSWSLKSLPFSSQRIGGYSLKSQDSGQFLVHDKIGGDFFVTQWSNNVLNLSNLPRGEVLYQDLDRIILKTKPDQVAHLRLHHSSKSYRTISLPLTNITQVSPLGDTHLVINKSLLINIEDGSSTSITFPDGLRVLNSERFTSDLHTIGKIECSPSTVTLSAAFRPEFAGVDESVALNCNDVIASTVNAEAYGMEYVNMQTNKVSFIPLHDKQVLLRSNDMKEGELFSLQRDAKHWMLNKYTLASHALGRELREWQRQLGSTPRFDPSSPKHGQEDDLEHHGGNTWAGGTGGSDTAGLGGIGGPYRLDKGFDVHQVSDEMKRSVPPHIIEQARKMAKEALARRLKEIEMSDSEHGVYRAYLNDVKDSIQALRVVIEGLDGNKCEREWVRHRSEGDVDEGKLVEAASGERNIFKRRMEPQDATKSKQEKPKRLVLLADVSGSMYRFNGYDKRLERELESTLMLMEALHGFDRKVQYEIIGHSGEQADISFVKLGAPPQNEKERFRVLQKMYAHSQFCFSGDSTIEAMEKTMQRLNNCDQFDETVVILLSDANLDRYGIPGHHLGKIMQSKEPEVHSYTILIGSIGGQAHMLKRELPPGHAFLCMNSKDLPQIIKQIFTSKLIN